MKCFLLLTFVALSCAIPFYGGSKSINIDDDGTIVITAANGKRVTISKAVGMTDDKFIDIAVEVPNLPTKRIRINEQGSDKTVNVQSGPYSGQFNGQYWEDDMREKRSPKVATATKDSKKSKTQADLLYTVFKQYEGVVDEKSYESLLKKVNEYVESGELDTSVSDVLKYLHDQKLSQEQTTTEAGVQAPVTTKIPTFHADIAGMVKNYIWTNKYPTPAPSGNVAPEASYPYGQQGTPEQNVVGQYAEQWRQQQQPSQWTQPQAQYVNWPYYQQSVAQQQWVPQQQWVSQQQPWVSQQQQWVPQPQWVPQQQQSTPEQVSSQKSTYNPWIAYYLGQIWNQQRKSLEQQTTYPVTGGRVVGYPTQNPWQYTGMNSALVF